MHATDPPNCIPITRCFLNPYQPKVDDQVVLARLYPVLGGNTARIHGSVFFTDVERPRCAGHAGSETRSRCRILIRATGQPSHAVAASVSGFLLWQRRQHRHRIDDSTGQPQTASDRTTLRSKDRLI